MLRNTIAVNIETKMGKGGADVKNILHCNECLFVSVMYTALKWRMDYERDAQQTILTELDFL
jgi:hypothetical protein